MKTFAKSSLAVAAFLPIGLLFEVDWQAVVGRPAAEALRVSEAAFEADTLREKRHAGGKAGCEAGAKGEKGRGEDAADEEEPTGSEARETAARVAT
jgi:hypothetical protein